MEVICTAVSDDVEITVGVARSELAGTESRVQLSQASTGETIGRGGGSSEWGVGTFQAAITVFDNDGAMVGEVFFSGGYAPTGEPERTVNRFNAGNVHVVEDHTETVAEVSDVVLRFGDITFANPDCVAFLTDGSLFFTNPATVVSFGTSLVHECTGTNLLIEQTTIADTLDELFVDVWFADRPDANASGLVIAADGVWQGEFRLFVADEPAGTVAASATLVRSGQPFHATEGPTGMRNHFQVTPYQFTMSIDGPEAPASLDCTLFEVRQKLHFVNPAA